MSCVDDGDFSCSLSNGSSSNATPRTDGVLTAPLQQISDFISVNLHVRAKQLRLNQPFGLCNAASSLKRSQSCSASSRCDSSKRMHVVGGGIGGEGGRGMDCARGGRGRTMKCVSLSAASSAIRHDQAALAVQKRCNWCIRGVSIQVLRLNLQVNTKVKSAK